MKVVLKDDIKNIGKMGQIVDVTAGYARNYLVPRGLAVEANTKNIKSLEHQKRIIQDNATKIKNSAQDLSNKISTITLVIKAKSGEEGKLFRLCNNYGYCRAASKGRDRDRQKEDFP